MILKKKREISFLRAIYIYFVESLKNFYAKFVNSHLRLGNKLEPTLIGSAYQNTVSIVDFTVSVYTLRNITLYNITKNVPISSSTLIRVPNRNQWCHSIDPKTLEKLLWMVVEFHDSNLLCRYYEIFSLSSFPSLCVSGNCWKGRTNLINCLFFSLDVT